MEKMINKIMIVLRLKASRIWCSQKKRKVIHTRINGYDLLVLANEDVGRQIHYVGCYEQAEANYLRKEISLDATCVDIGANVGYFTMLMAQAASAGSVHAFEPIALNLSLLKASAELNGYTNIHTNQCAVGNVEGKVSFSQSSDSAYSSIMDTERKPLDRVFNVPCITLDAYLEHKGITRVDVIKVDVEGAEELVITGAVKLFSDSGRRPRVILMELYDGNLQAFGSSVDSIVERLRRFGYRPFVLNKDGEALPFRDEMKPYCYNVFFLLLSGMTANNEG